MLKANTKLEHLVSIRGIAAWWVVVFHSMALLDSMPRILFNAIANGYLAVDLFFILSGFVIFINYHGKFISFVSSNFAVFYWHRFTRIYPVHAMLLAAYFLLAVSFIYFSNSGTPPDSYTARSFIESLLLLNAWTGSSMSWNVPSWSISAEWFVYLLFPIIAVLLRKFAQGVTAHFLIGIGLLFAIIFAYSANQLNSLGDDVASMALIRASLQFTLGSIIGSLYVKHNAFLEKNRILLAAGFVGACLIYIKTGVSDYILMPAAFFSLISYLSVDRSFFQAALSNKVLVYLGEISYSTYMVHYFVYDVFKAGFVTKDSDVNQLYLLLSFLVVLAMSIVMHHTFELPMQRYLRSKLFSYRLNQA